MTKEGASEGGTPYIIRGAGGRGADKGAAERRLTGGRKYAPKGNGKDEKEKKDGKGNIKKRKKHAKEERKRRKKRKKGINSSLKFEIKAKQFYAASQRVL